MPPDDPLVSDASVVEWYRLDQRRRLLRVLLLGALPVLVGMVLASVGVLQRDARDPLQRHRGRPMVVVFTDDAEPARPPAETGELWLFGIGMIIVAAGPLATIFGLRRVMEVEHYLLLRTDGLLHADGTTSRLVPWDDVEEVAYDEAGGASVLCLRSGELVRLEARYEGIEPRRLARRLEEVRRKAAWCLLPQQQR